MARKSFCFRIDLAFLFEAPVFVAAAGFGMGDVHATVLAEGDEVSMGYYGLLQVTRTYYD